MSTTMQISLYEAMQCGKFSDLTLCLQDGTTIKCHRVVLCTQCEFFDTAVKPGQFKESSGIIKLENDHPAAIKCLVDFLYTGKYTIVPEDVDILELSSKDYANTMWGHAQVYIVSVIYRVPELQAMASEFIKLGLTDRAFEVFPRLFHDIKSNVPESVCSLRGDLMKFAEDHVVELTSGKNFQNMITWAPKLVRGLMHSLAKSRQQARSRLKHAQRRICNLEAKVSSSPKNKYQCPKCNEIFDTVMPAFRVRVGCPGCGVTRLTSSWDDFKLSIRGD